MRIASISIVKDEADIIEVFVRHNLAFIDRMFIVDDRSTDNTGEILRRLALENPSVTILDDGWNGAFHQGKRTTAALKIVRKLQDWDCVVALDGDEFICADSRSTFESEIRAIPPGSAGGFPMINYCIHPTDDPSIRDPVARIEYAMPLSGDICKSFAAGELLKTENLAFGEGNHKMFVADTEVASWPLPSVTLAHFATRSMDQFALKVLKHYVTSRSRADYVPDHNSGIIATALALKTEPAFALDRDRVRPLYLLPDPRDLAKRPFRERQGALKWPELAVTRPYAQLLGLFDEMIDRLSVIDHLSMFSGESDQVAALKRLLGDRDRLLEDREGLHKELHTLKHSRSAAGKNYLGVLSASLKQSWRKRFSSPGPPFTKDR